MADFIDASIGYLAKASVEHRALVNRKRAVEAQIAATAQDLLSLCRVMEVAGFQLDNVGALRRVRRSVTALPVPGVIGQDGR